jgi:hypothetical protein
MILHHDNRLVAKPSDRVNRSMYPNFSSNARLLGSIWLVHSHAIVRTSRWSKCVGCIFGSNQPITGQYFHKIVLPLVCRFQGLGLSAHILSLVVCPSNVINRILSFSSNCPLTCYSSRLMRSMFSTQVGRSSADFLYPFCARTSNNGATDYLCWSTKLGNPCQRCAVQHDGSTRCLWYIVQVMSRSPRLDAS